MKDKYDNETIDIDDLLIDELEFTEEPDEFPVCELCGHAHDDDNHRYCEECGSPLTNNHEVI